MSVAGHAPLDLPFTASITEVIGTAPIAGANPPQSVPAVIRRTNSTSVPFISWLIPLFNYYAAYVVLRVGSRTENAGGLISSLTAAIPARIPFSNTSLPLPNPPDFPVLILDWTDFEVTSTGILGAGKSSIGSRDQSVTAVTVTGPGEISGYQSDLSGGALQQYDCGFTNLVPDPHGLTWATSGAISRGGEIAHGGLAQSGSFQADFGLIPKVQPGTYPFTLAVNATETCGTDASKKLTASTSQSVKVEVKKDPKLPQ